jgi:hypothetical protein
MEIKGDAITFSSGRQAYANCGIVGINSALELHQGYDGTIDFPVPEWWRTDHPEWINEKTLTADDMRELADFMIDLWSKFKATLEPKP